MPDLVAGLSVAGLALVTILTVCLATVLLVRRWATGEGADDDRDAENEWKLTAILQILIPDHHQVVGFC